MDSIAACSVLCARRAGKQNGYDPLRMIVAGQLPGLAADVSGNDSEWQGGRGAGRDQCATSLVWRELP
jgi:hypothetical protein